MPRDLHEGLCCHRNGHALDEGLYLIGLLAHLVDMDIPVAC